MLQFWTKHIICKNYVSMYSTYEHNRLLVHYSWLYTHITTNIQFVGIVFLRLVTLYALYQLG